MLRLRRTVHEIPLPERPLLAFDDQDSLTGEDEEVLLFGLPVVGAGRLAGPHHADRHPEHGKERLGLVLVVAGQRHAVALAGLVEPAQVSDVLDEPAGALGDEPGVGLFEFGLGNHAAMIRPGPAGEAAGPGEGPPQSAEIPSIPGGRSVTLPSGTSEPSSAMRNSSTVPLTPVSA